MACPLRVEGAAEGLLGFLKPPSDEGGGFCQRQKPEGEILRSQPHHCPKGTSWRSPHHCPEGNIMGNQAKNAPARWPKAIDMKCSAQPNMK